MYAGWLDDILIGNITHENLVEFVTKEIAEFITDKEELNILRDFVEQYGGWSDFISYILNSKGLTNVLNDFNIDTFNEWWQSLNKCDKCKKPMNAKRLGLCESCEWDEDD